MSRNFLLLLGAVLICVGAMTGWHAAAVAGFFFFVFSPLGRR